MFLEKLILFQFPTLFLMEHKFIYHKPMSQDQSLTGKNPVHTTLRNNQVPVGPVLPVWVVETICNKKYVVLGETDPGKCWFFYY
jgi:hypothetical protein